MNIVAPLIQETEQSRDQFLASVAHLTFVQATFQPDPDTWSILVITESYRARGTVGRDGDV